MTTVTEAGPEEEEESLPRDAPGDGEEASADRTDFGRDPDALDTAFAILSNRRRRLVLRRLEEIGGESDTSDLAEYVASVENDKPQAALSAQERKRVYVGLYQSHLPKMDEEDVLDVDDDGTVRFGPRADEVLAFLQGPSEASRIWPVFYAGHTAMSALGLTLGAALAPALVPYVFASSLLGFGFLVVLHLREVGLPFGDDGGLEFSS